MGADMYVKRHAVVRGSTRYVYLRLVEAYRDESGRVRHRVLRTLGREDELKASGQLEQLAASFARLDPPPAGTRRHVGPLLLVHHYVHRLGLVGLIDDAVPMRGRAMLTHGEVIAALVANRLCGPAPLYDVAGWASSAAVAELFGCSTTTGSAGRWRRWPRWPSGCAASSRWPPRAGAGLTCPGCIWT